jgi:MoaA/NifB/PqqE/SkfB family radical SAM enzyme
MFTDIKVGYSCNNRCVHCVVEPSRRDRQRNSQCLDSSTEEILAFIDEAWVRGSNFIVLTGGEVTIRKDFLQLVEYASNLGLQVAVQTNGRRLEALDREGAFEKMRATFTVAVHGPDENVHDLITRRAGSFAETIRGLRALCRHSMITVTGKLVISKLNQKELCATLEMLVGLGLRHFNVAFPHAERFTPDEFSRVVPRYRDLGEELDRCANFLSSTCYSSEFETIPYCVMPNSPEIWKRSADALLITNSKDNPGFIRASGDDCIHDWETERQQIKYKGKQCRRCLFDKACEGPWIEYVETYGDEELQPLCNPEIIEMLE